MKMNKLTEQDLLKLEHYYYWVGHRDWVPFPEELNSKLLEAYGEEPFHYTWSEQDIHEGTRKIIIEYFQSL